MVSSKHTQFTPDYNMKQPWWPIFPRHKICSSVYGP